jgi:FkbM family methyltransferase
MSFILQKFTKKKLTQFLRRKYWNYSYKGKSEVLKCLQSEIGTLMVRIGEDVGGNIFADGVHEYEETVFMKNVLEQDWVCLDIGANIGYFSVLMSKLCTSGKVIAVEPIPENVDVILSNIDINNLTNLNVEAAAIDKVSGSREFAVMDDSAYSGFVSTKRRDTLKLIEVKTIRPFDLLLKHGVERLDFVKIDVEGAEFDIFMACQEMFEKFKPKYILSEMNQGNLEAYGASLAVLMNLMEDYGYVPGVLGAEANWIPLDNESLGDYDNVVFKGFEKSL